MSSGPGVLKRAWYRWKSLQLPWRRNRLIGVDLSGNTFWEFKDALNSNRFRRIVKYGNLKHYADVRISPQWHQWLRHTRESAPTIEEQQYEVMRQTRMKQLAFEADERWKSTPSYLDSPNKQQPAPAIGVKDPGGYAQQTEPEDKQGVRSAVESQPMENAAAENGSQEAGVGDKAQERKEKKRGENPYQQKGSRGAPSENWQPESWSPGVAQKRR